MLCRCFLAPFQNNNHLSWTVDNSNRCHSTTMFTWVPSMEAILALLAPEILLLIKPILFRNSICHSDPGYFTHLVNHHDPGDVWKSRHPHKDKCFLQTLSLSAQLCIWLFRTMFAYVHLTSQFNLFQCFALFVTYLQFLHFFRLPDTCKYCQLKSARLLFLLCLFPWDSAAFILESDT